MKKCFLFILLLLIVTGLAGCNAAGGNYQTDNAEVPESSFVHKAKELSELATSKNTAVIEGKPTIGVVMPSLSHPGWIGIFSGIVKGAIKNNAGMVVFSADENVQLQANIIEDLIVKKVDGIIFVPVDSDSEALTAVVKKANSAKIPIVSLDRSTTGGKLDGLVESDNLEIGREAARQMAGVGSGKELRILNLQGNMSTSAGIERSKGFVEEIQKYANCKIVKEKSGYWRPDKGNEAVLEAFRENPDINAIYVPSDLYTQGIIAALDQLGKLRPVGYTSHVILVTVDGQPTGLEYIRKDYVDVDVGQRVVHMGEQALEMCIKTIKGVEIVERDVKIPPEVVTKDNINDPELWGNQFR